MQEFDLDFFFPSLRSLWFLSCWCRNFPGRMTSMWLWIHFLMKICSLFIRMILGTNILLYISRLSSFLDIIHRMISDGFDTKWRITSSLVTLCIFVGLIHFFIVAWIIKKQSPCWTITIVEHVAAIYLGWKQLEKSCMMGNFAWQSLKISLRRSRGVVLAIYFLEKCMHILLHFFPSSLSVYLQSGELI